MNYAQVVKERIHTRDFLAAFGISVGRNGMVCCPIHGEKTPSLKVYDEPTRGWHCFGCQKGGDVIDMAMAMWGVGFKDALHQLNDDFAIGLPLDIQPSCEERLRMAQEIERIRREREERRAREQAAEQAYWIAYDAWLSNENVILDQAPKSPEEEPSDAFTYAVTHRAEFADAMELAKDRWRDMLRAKHEHQDATVAKKRVF